MNRIIARTTEIPAAQPLMGVVCGALGRADLFSPARNRLRRRQLR